MNVTKASLERITQHWAIQAISDDEINQAVELSNRLLVEKAVGNLIHFNYKPSKSDYQLLDRVSMAYEIAAIEGLNDFLNPTSSAKELSEQCASGAHKAFEIQRLFEIPNTDLERIYHILHLSSLAYCGDRWTDLRRWYNENEQILQTPSVNGEIWDQHLVNLLFNCWVCLFRKKRWEDLDRISEVISELRENQNKYEFEFLNNTKNAEQRSMALRLISLYHWAKATEILAKYMLQGEPAGVTTLLNKHFESALKAVEVSGDIKLELLLRWLQIAGRRMITDSIWWIARSINSRVTKFVNEVTKQQALFELLPPQRAAIQEQGLLDQAATAIVVDMPTSGGKTLLAQFRILQALNQFDQDESGKGWVAYVAPTKALTAQITRRLRRDFEPIGVKVEQLTGAIEIDAFEEDLLVQTEKAKAFDVLVATPEKLQLIIRNKKVPRPLALVVMDEAHNIEDETRGLRIELLLATIKGECSSANFLLLMPYVEKPDVLARWLAQDINAGRTISFGTTPWKPNDRIVGIFKAEANDSINAGWHMKYETLTTTPNTIHLKGEYIAGDVRPLNFPKSSVLKNDEQAGITLQTAAMARIMSERGTSIAVANNTSWVWNMARKILETMEQFAEIPDEIQLVQNFLRTEISTDFELIEMLSRGIGVHHSGLSDEVKTLMEWLAEEGKLRVLCATTTIAQGINFPVSSVFLASNNYPYGQEMSPREFWNLAGRAGRMNHDSVGVVGLAAGNEPQNIIEYVSRSTGELASRLVKMLDEVEQAGNLNNLGFVIQNEQWEDFRCYVAHLWNEKKNLDAVLSNTEQLLRNTLGYGLLESRPDQKIKAEKLLEVTKNYARILSNNPGYASLADMTGFSPEGIRRAMAGIKSLDKELTVKDWKPGSLFGEQSGMADLYGVMLKIPQLKGNLEEITSKGFEHSQLSNITKAWVNGKSIEEITRDYFSGDEVQTKDISAACKAIYKTLVNNGTWGMSALSRLSGFDFDQLSNSEKRLINMVPAMIYHGVKSEEGVLLRMNSVPRSIAESLGSIMKDSVTIENRTVQDARSFLKQTDISTWDRAIPRSSSLSGKEYKQIWHILSGEE
ncbi:MAG: DEAD/DEAH box helicase [Rhodobacteraceae bacterium]|nr:DEAD/DEAH box helicase [Gammaproteobacteria bacterium]MXZ50664.1 DEAD/DEAH box helicase [Paracoccaceae bacterium]MYF45735.1 DEAD/DEAH box helicase [Paracoccaceae bacterium]